jgi:hypothetical protein
MVSFTLRPLYPLEQNRRYPMGSGIRWEDNIKMHLRKLGYEALDWVHLTHGRDQWRTVARNVDEPSGFVKDAEFLGQLSKH